MLKLKKAILFVILLFVLIGMVSFFLNSKPDNQIYHFCDECCQY
jgi:hypothetical protein